MRVFATSLAPIMGLFHANGGNALIVRTGTSPTRLAGLDARTGEQLWVRNCEGNAIVSANGSRVADVTQHGDTVVWDVATWEVIANFNHDFPSERGFAISPDGQEAAGFSHWSGVWRWTLPPGFPHSPLDVSVEAVEVRYSPGGTWLVALTRPPNLRVWHRTGPRLHTDIGLPVRLVGNVRFDLSPDEDTIAVLLEKPVLLSIGHRHEPRPLTASRGLVFSTAFSPDGKRLLLGTNDGIRVWDVPNGVDSKWFDFGFGAATALSFSPDGLTCAAGGENGQIVVWDVDA